MHRNGAVPDNPHVLRGTWRAIGVRCGTRDRAGREIELQMPRVAEGRLDRDTVDPNKDAIINPLPSSTTRTDGDPSVTLLGWIELITGAKVDAASGTAGLRSVTYSGW